MVKFLGNIFYYVLEDAPFISLSDVFAFGLSYYLLSLDYIFWQAVIGVILFYVVYKCVIAFMRGFLKEFFK